MSIHNFRDIKTNQMVNCMVYKELSGDSRKAIELSLGWDLPNREVSSNFDLNAILFKDTGESVCLVRQEADSKTNIIEKIQIFFVFYKINCFQAVNHQ